MVCSQKKGRGQIHKDTDFPRDREEISWKTRRVSGEGRKKKKKHLIFIARL